MTLTPLTTSNAVPRTRPWPTPSRPTPQPAQCQPEPDAAETLRIDRQNFAIRSEALRRDQHKVAVERAELAEMAERLQIASTETAATMARQIGTEVDRHMVINNPAAVAAQIIAAGEKRRAGANNVALPGGLAGEIIKSGMRRRGEIQDDRMPPVGSLAWKILESGRKRRGEA